MGDHTRDPAYYEQPAPMGQLATLVFNAVAADDLPSSVNYDASAPPMRVQVTDVFHVQHLCMPLHRPYLIPI